MVTKVGLMNKETLNDFIYNYRIKRLEEQPSSICRSLKDLFNINSTEYNFRDDYSTISIEMPYEGLERLIDDLARLQSFVDDLVMDMQIRKENPIVDDAYQKYLMLRGLVR